VTSLFDNRLTHILNHEHSTLGKPWKSLSQYIIGFEAENEAMIGQGEPYIQAHLNWCVIPPMRICGTGV
jgi:mannan endo-1,4-beta-mannosidase